MASLTERAAAAKVGTMVLMRVILAVRSWAALVEAKLVQLAGGAPFRLRAPYRVSTSRDR